MSEKRRAYLGHALIIIGAFQMVFHLFQYIGQGWRLSDLVAGLIGLVLFTYGSWLTWRNPFQKEVISGRTRVWWFGFLSLLVVIFLGVHVLRVGIQSGGPNPLEWAGVVAGGLLACGLILRFPWDTGNRMQKTTEIGVTNQ